MDKELKQLKTKNLLKPRLYSFDETRKILEKNQKRFFNDGFESGRDWQNQETIHRLKVGMKDERLLSDEAMRGYKIAIEKLLYK